jgi:hypothetical protein
VRGALGFSQKHVGRERQEELKRKKQKFHSSLAARPGEEERGTVSLETTLFSSFFFSFFFFSENHETASFWTKRAVSFKYGANMSTSKSVFNLSFVHFNCIPINFNRRPYSWPPFSLRSLVSDFLN